MLSLVGRGGMPRFPRFPAGELQPPSVRGVPRRGESPARLHRSRVPSCHCAMSSGTSSPGVTLCAGNKLELSTPGLGLTYQPPLCFCASQPHCNYSGLPIHKSTEQPQNKEGSKYLLSGFLPAHSTCGSIHSSDGNLMDQTPPGTKSCFRTRHVSVSRREVIHCCPCWCLGEALAGVQALLAAGVHWG